jgi:hypothetical protein
MRLWALRFIPSPQVAQAELATAASARHIFGKGARHCGVRATKARSVPFRPPRIRQSLDIAEVERIFLQLLKRSGRRSARAPVPLPPSRCQSGVQDGLEPAPALWALTSFPRSSRGMRPTPTRGEGESEPTRAGGEGSPEPDSTPVSLHPALTSLRLHRSSSGRSGSVIREAPRSRGGGFRRRFERSALPFRQRYAGPVPRGPAASSPKTST